MPAVQTYLNTGDHLTVWQLAHDWAGESSNESDPNDLPPEIKAGIYRLLVAIRNRLISVRNHEGIIILGGSFWSSLFYFSHLLKVNACLTNNRFEKAYLDSLYVWRPEVIRWCASDQLPIPQFWQSNPPSGEGEAGGDDTHWYGQLTPRKKQIVAALHIAARLWEENRALSYEDVWNHPDMKKLDKPRIFPSLASFKEWARDIAPQEAKSPGKRKISV